MTEETLEEFQERIRKEYGPMYYDRKGKEMTLMEWGHMCQARDYKIVKQEKIGKYFVSTVWIGVNMEMFRQTPIKIFETMILIPNGEEEENQKDDLYFYQERYSTEEEAFQGHEQTVFVVKCKLEGKNIEL